MFPKLLIKVYSWYIEKYGQPKVVTEKFDAPYFDGSGNEKQALKEGQCVYEATFSTNTGNGMIRIQIHSDMSVMLVYVDTINYRLLREAAKKQYWSHLLWSPPALLITSVSQNTGWHHAVQLWFSNQLQSTGWPYIKKHFCKTIICFHNLVLRPGWRNPNTRTSPSHHVLCVMLGRPANFELPAKN